MGSIEDGYCFSHTDRIYNNRLRKPTMNKEKQRIAIAEFCGYWFCNVYAKPAHNHDKKKAYHFVNELPNYLKDLNAMHEAEKILDYESWNIYVITLANITRKDQHLNWIIPNNCITAPAKHRAEALLRTIGKWEE
jgi:hypothetical protein